MTQIIEIERALRSFLLAPGEGFEARRRVARQKVRAMLGDAIFAGNRRPKGGEGHNYQAQAGSAVTLALTISRLTVNREYGLDGEDGVCQSVLTLTSYGRGARADLMCKRLAEWLRMALSNYRGTWRYRDDEQQLITVAVDTATVVAERELPAIASNNDDRWHHRYAVDWRITHNQPVPED